MKCKESLLRSKLARVAILCLLALLLWAAPGPAVHAATRTVCASGCDYTTIQAAINAAYSGDVISVLNAVHTEAGITVKKNVTIQGQGVANTIIQAHTAPNSAGYRVFTVNIGVTATIQKMTIRYGSVIGGVAQGGGIYNNGLLTLQQVMVTANQAVGGASGNGEPAYGGAIYNNGTLTVRNSTISGNRALGGNTVDALANAGNAYGGGIYNYGSLSIQESTINNNTAQGGNATAEYSGGGDAYGGGLYNLGALMVQGSTIGDNSAQAGVAEGPSGYSGDAYGGGVVQWLTGEELVSFSATTLSSNSAQGGNAGSMTGEAGSAYGGGVAQWGSESGTLAFTNCTISGNTAQGGESYDGYDGGGAEGGGLRGSGGLLLSYSTVRANQALGINAMGGGLRSYAGLGAGPVLEASILSGNSGTLAANGPDLSGNAQSLDYNLIESPGGFTLSGTTAYNLIGQAPLLGPLQDNGGPTRTHALEKGSPAINHLPNGKVGCGTTVTEDQRGVTRPQDLACDIGSFELVKTGQLEVVKGLEPSTDAGRFHLQIDGVTEKSDAGDGDSTGKVTVNVGIHSVGEVAGTGTSLTSYSSSIECRDSGGQGAVVASGSTAGPLNVTVGEDQDIVCTIGNIRFGTVIVKKQTEPNGDPVTFAFGGVVSGSLKDGQTLTKAVLPGTYTEQETVPAGWDLRTIHCEDPTADSAGDIATRTATYRIAAGETVKCTFTNTKRGWVQVQKKTEPGGDPAGFTFNGVVNGSVNDGGTLAMEVAPGAYTAREVVPAGWDLTAIQCDDPTGDSSGDVELRKASYLVAPGETVKCTFTNTKRGRVVVEKQTAPAGDPANFSFSGVVSGKLQDGQTLASEVLPGTYSAQEAARVGWDLTDIRCEDPTADSTGDLATGTATYRVAAGETVRCVFTNTKRGLVTVEKQTQPDADLTNFFFSGVVSGKLKDGQTLTQEVVPGTYAAQEAARLGWDLTDIRCADPTADSSADVTTGTATYRVAPGETITCTFTNVRRATVQVEKQTEPDGDPASFTFSGALSGSLYDGGTLTQEVVPGTYTVQEATLTAWDLRTIQCDDPTGDSAGDVATKTATFRVGPGETARCVYTNTKRGSIVIEKQTEPDGNAASFTFSGAVSGTAKDGQTLSKEVVPGSYTVQEATLADWDLRELRCVDPTGDSTGDLATKTATYRVSAGETVRCVFTNTKRGLLQLEKQTDPDGDPGSFTFMGELGGVVTDGQILSKKVAPGSYAVQEVVPTEWDLTGIRCDDPTTDSTADLTSQTATYRVGAGETVKCLFTNTKRGVLVVEKQAEPDGDPSSFAFSGDVSGLIKDGQTLAKAVPPGTYSVQEMVPAGWDISRIQCSDLDSTGVVGTGVATYRVSPGETVRCIFTNTKRGMLVVEKQTEPDGDPAGFAFSGTVSGSAKDGQTLTKEVVPGTYSTQEAALAGWDLRAVQCEDPTADSTVDLSTKTATFRVSPGETVRCVFTNTKRGTLVVEKRTEPDGDAASFAFSGAVSGGAKDGQTLSKEVAPGMYGVQEAALAGWDLRTIQCDDPTGDSAGDPATRTATYRVSAGETVTCVFTNTKQGLVVVEKQTEPDGDAASFAFSGAVSGSAKDGQTLTKEVAPGTYSVQETALAGWDLRAIQCDDPSADSVGEIGTKTATFRVSPGETVRCVFTNTKRSMLVVEKQTEPDGDPASFDLSGAVSGSAKDGQTLTKEVVPGTYSTQEAVLAGWVLREIRCNDPTADSTADLETRAVTFRVSPGETVRCVFTNTKHGMLVVEKQTVPDGDPSSFTFSGDASGLIKDGQTLAAQVAPGTYSVQEMVPAGWDVSHIQCSDPSGDSSGVVETGATTYRVGPGETVRCVYTNTKRGVVVAEKQTEPDGDATRFAFSGAVSGSAMDGQTLTQEVVPGIYSVQEAALPGWDLRTLQCDDPSGNSTGTLGTRTATYRVGAGETVTCRFTNTKRGAITIVKDARPDGTVAFSFTGTLGSFSLRDDGSNPSGRTFSNLLPGLYTVTEQVPSAWRLTGLTCLDPDVGTSVDLAGARATIDLDAGDEITCTFENTKRGTIVVAQQTQPQGAPGVFSFGGDAAGSISVGEVIAVSGLQPGVYTSQQTVLPGWVLHSILCSDPSGNSTGDVSTQTATFRLEAGEIIECTFTNTRPANLVLEKSLVTAHVLRGQPITYTLAFSNTAGVLAPAVVIRDLVPPQLADVHFTSSRPITPTGDISYTWQVGSLPAGEGGIITLSGVISMPRVLTFPFTNTAVISASVVEMDPQDNVDSVPLVITDAPPLGVIDGYSTGQDTPLVSPPYGGVLDNDSDPEGDPLLANLVAGPAHGLLTLSLDGSFAYTPTTAFAGADAFTYVANDSLLDSAPTTVTLTVVSSQYPVYLPLVLRSP